MAAFKDVLIRKRLLLAQVMFTALAFFLMVVLSHHFANNLAGGNMSCHADNVFTLAGERVESDLRESELLLESLASNIRVLIMQGDDADSLRSHINDMSDHMLTGGKRVSKANNYSFYFETGRDAPLFLSGGDLKPAGEVDFTRQEWYQPAVEAGGAIVEIPPYKSSLSDEAVITYARSIFDDQGRRLGVARLDVAVRDIGRDVLEIALNKGGYGMLLDQELNVVAHVDPEMTGMNIRDGNTPLSALPAICRREKKSSGPPLRTGWGKKPSLLSGSITAACILPFSSRGSLFTKA